MLIDTSLLSETEQRFADRQTKREEGVRLIRAGNLLQADSPERVQARLNRLGIDRRVAERVAGTQTGLWEETKRRIVDSAEQAPDGNALPPSTFLLDPDTFFLTSQSLDFTLIAVNRQAAEGTGDLEEIGGSRLVEAEGKVINGEYATIVQHPNGQPKQIALRKNQIIDV